MKTVSRAPMVALSYRARGVVPLVIAAIVAATLSLVTLATPASAAPPTVSVSIEGGNVLAGEDGTYSISATNTGATDGFNLAFILDVPEGIDFIDSSLGEPSIYSAGNPPPTPLAPGMQRWVWEDVSDLPANGTYNGTITLHPQQPAPDNGETDDPIVSPVGAQFTLTATAALSGDPAYLPVFNGSTGVGTAPAIAETAISAEASVTSSVVPLLITKSEPSPEAELMRGIHNDTTVYTLEITATSEGPTDDAILIDYLPAGLEFLGCGAVDNSTVDRGLGDVDINEFDGAPSLDGAPELVGDCPHPSVVETIVADAIVADAYGLIAGAVYTLVLWELGTLDPGSVTRVRYVAGIPLRENTMTWDNAGGEPPIPWELGQVANLDNNNGPSTRHGSFDEHLDGDTWRNAASIDGTYRGVVRTGTDRTVLEYASQTVHAMDLRILKEIDDADRQFAVGNVADFYLTLRASEYMYSSDIVITDEISNGLCPLLPGGAEFIVEVGAPEPTDCGDEGLIVGAEFVSATAHPDGTFTLVLRPTDGGSPDDFVLAPDTEHVITYPVLNRGSYVTAEEYGFTTSGDSFGNTVSFTAVTDAIEPLLADYPMTYRVWDDSGATITSDLTTISKRVVAREDVQKDLAPGVNPCPDTGYTDDTVGDFRLGDTVCFELRVNFPSSIDVRNPVVTDFLPNGLTYAGMDVRTATPVFDEVISADGKRIDWKLGSLGEGGDLYIPRGHVFVAHVWATVDAPSNGTVQDKPENLMKYRQQNVHGELYFLRDQADILVDPEMQLLKGVESVLANGGVVWEPERDAASEYLENGEDFLSNRDGIQVVEGETVRFRVDLFALPYDATASEVWDVLPAGISAADVSNITDGGLAFDPSDSGHPTGDGDPNTALPAELASRSIIVWKNVAVPAGQKTLSYDVTIPLGTGAGSSLENIASIISYRAGINTSTLPDAQLYVPSGSLNTALEEEANTDGAGTTDDSSLYLPNVSVSKSATSPTGTNNTAVQVVHGEEAEFAYSVTIPAHTSVLSGTLQDILPTPANWQIVSSASYVTHPDGFTTPGSSDPFVVGGSDPFAFSSATGLLTFPAVYTNASSSPQTFTVHLTAYVKSTATWNHAPSSARTDTARFTSASTGQRDATASVRVIEPDPSISKTASPTSVTAGQTVTFTVTASNATSRPNLFDTVVTDCVPAELQDVALGVPSQGSVSSDTSAPGCDGTLITWNVGTLQTGTNATLAYTAEVSPASAGGASYTNDVDLIGYGLDDDSHDRRSYSESTSATVTVVGATIAKSVDQPTATIGQERTFTITATIPANVNFYDAVIIDNVPASMAISDATVTCLDSAALPADCMADLPGGGAALDASGTLQGWWLGNIVSDPLVRTVKITYTGTVLDDSNTDEGDTIVNTVRMRWNTEATLTEAPDASFTGTSSTSPATATITIHEPVVSVAKDVNGLNSDYVDPDEDFYYTVAVTNTGESTAYGITIEDEVPVGVVVDASSISGGGVLTGAGADGGGTITWTLASLPVDGLHSFTYTAVLANSWGLDESTLTNEVTVTQYFSHPTGSGYDDDERREYEGTDADADVTPRFPDPRVTKTVSGGNVAYIGQAKTFTLTISNEGNSRALWPLVYDTLPLGWEYIAGSAKLDGVDYIDPGISTTPQLEQHLEWIDLAHLDPGDSIELSYDARPAVSHEWTADNTGADYAHVNSVYVAAFDTSGSHQNLERIFEDDDDETVYIHEADLTIAKSHDGDIVAGSVVDWLITVTNNGPDTSVGPIYVTDYLPEGADPQSILSTGAWAFVSWDEDTRQYTVVHAGNLAADASSSFTFEASFPADIPAGTNVDNTACVTGTTFDPDTSEESNCATDEGDIVTLADVELTKELTGSDYIAGENITWTIDVVNHGPSISHAPFTVKDTLDSKVDRDTISYSGDGWECENGLGANDYVCVWEGDALGVGDSLPTLTITIEVRPSATGTIVNTATVTPTTDEPEDPGASNNTDTVTSEEVGTEADLVLTKSIVSDALVAGVSGRYRIEVRNDGPSDALDVTVTDTLPYGLTFAGNLTDDAGHNWTCEASGTVDGQVDCALTSNLGVLADGDSTWFEFDVDIASSLTDEITNYAIVDSTTYDPEPDNNEDEVSEDPLVETNISITKTHDGTPIYRVGDEVEFTVTVENHGPADAADVVVTDLLPGTAVQYQGVDDSDGWTAYERDGDTVEITLDDPLPAGESVSITVVVLILPDGVPGFTNEVSVVTSTDETDYTDNEDDEPVAVDSPDLEITKVANASLVEGGDSFTYTLTVSNVDDDAHADQVIITDEIPHDLKVTTELDDIGGDDWECELAGADSNGFGGTLTCTLETLDAESTAAEVTFTVLVADDVARDVIPNTAEVSSDDEHEDYVDESNEDSDSVDVKWIHFTGESVCVADVPWFQYTIDPRNLDEDLPITLTWYADNDNDGVPDGPAVAVQDLTAATGSSPITDQILWPGAAVDENGVGIGWPGWRVVEAGETPDWENYIEDPTLPEWVLRAGALVVVTINPESGLHQEYPPPTVDCEATRDAVLGIDKEVDGFLHNRSETVTYRINVENIAYGATDDVVLRDPIPSSLKVTNIEIEGVTDPTLPVWTDCEVTGQDSEGYGGVLECTLDGWLGYDQRMPEVVFTATIKPGTALGKLTNVATVYWTDPDGDENEVFDEDAEADITLVLSAEELLALTGVQALGVLWIAAFLLALGAALKLFSRKRREA